ncbi:MAG TPA: hypothetical protein VGE35_00525 [Candidatus Paceibacterota bacterium]
MDEIPELTALPEGGYRPTDPKRTLVALIGNLHLHFPQTADVGGRGYYRKLVETQGLWDNVPISEVSDEDPLDWRESPLRLSQTNRQFYTQLDETIGSLGFTPEKMGAKYLSLTSLEGEAWDKEFVAFYLPIYVALRRKGYSPKDLSE